MANEREEGKNLTFSSLLAWGERKRMVWRVASWVNFCCLYCHFFLLPTTNTTFRSPPQKSFSFAMKTINKLRWWWRCTWSSSPYSLHQLNPQCFGRRQEKSSTKNCRFSGEKHGKNLWFQTPPRKCFSLNKKQQEKPNAVTPTWLHTPTRRAKEKKKLKFI